MEKFLWLITAAAFSPQVFSQEKWVWSGRESKAGLARGDGKGRYGVYEPELPDESYNPGVRPPPASLPPLIRPSGRPSPPQFNNNGPYQFPSNNNFNNINNNRPSPSPDYTNNFNNRRPYPPTASIGQLPSYPGRPSVPRPPSVNQNLRPSQLLPSGPTKNPQNPDNKDPTNFDKCKCVYSFNCKSPGILFGTCDVGKKYCCEKFTANRPRGQDDDLGDPDILVGPGGPVDHFINGQGSNHRPGNSYGRLPAHSSLQ